MMCHYEALTKILNKEEKLKKEMEKCGLRDQLGFYYFVKFDCGHVVRIG